MCCVFDAVFFFREGGGNATPIQQFIAPATGLLKRKREMDKIPTPFSDKSGGW